MALESEFGLAIPDHVKLVWSLNAELAVFSGMQSTELN